MRESTGHVLRFVAGTVAFGALLFFLAGTVAWPAAWLYLAIASAIFVAYLVILITRHPELMEERRHPPADAKKWDKPCVVAVASVGPMVLVAVSGLDHRFGWTAPMPLALTVFGFLLVATGGALTASAIAANRFFSAVVRIQRDRGHEVVDSGPYQCLRHPGYVGSILYMAGTALALGSWWGMVVAVAVSIGIVLRTRLEDRTLMAELEGYAHYAQRVRYRLVPRVW